MSGLRHVAIWAGAAVAAAVVCGAVASSGAHKAAPVSAEPQPAGVAPSPLNVIWTRDATWPKRLRARVAGGALRWRDLRGSRVVLNFFASWCGPCRREAVLLSRAAKQQRGRVVFLAAAVHDYIPDAKRFLRAQRLPFAAVTAPATLVRSFGLIGLPETFFLDARGRLRTVARGELTASELARGLRRLGGR